MSTPLAVDSDFPSTDPVYRGARNRRCIQDGIVNEEAFYRRFTGDPSGISVAKTPEIAAEGIKSKGMIRIGASDIRSIRVKGGDFLDIVPDIGKAGKGNIVDPPCFDDPDKEKAAEGFRIARALARLAHPHP